MPDVGSRGLPQVLGTFKLASEPQDGHALAYARWRATEVRREKSDRGSLGVEQQRTASGALMSARERQRTAVGEGRQRAAVVGRLGSSREGRCDVTLRTSSDRTKILPSYQLRQSNRLQHI